MKLIKELKRRNVIRVATAYLIVAWLMIQVLGLATDSFEAPAWVMKLVITLVVIGFFISVIISWAYELTPEGIKRDKGVYHDDAISHHTAKKLDIITIVAVIAVGSLVIWQQLIKTEEKVNNIRPTSLTELVTTANEQGVSANSIAVLPFSDLSQNGDQEYFSDGMAEEILNVLVRVDALKVTSRTSAFQFKGSQLGIPEIAKQLKVRYVLEGSVRKSGETLRITAQLIDAQDDKHLWSETYDRPLTTENIFAIQDEISNSIVKALSQELNLASSSSVAVKQRTANLTAYELFLKARPLFIGRKNLDTADDLLIQAIELDANFAQALAMRSALATLKYAYGFSNIPKEQADIKSIEFANQALSIDPNNVLALASKANTRFIANEELRGKFDIAEIIADYKKALSIEPKNTTTLLWLGRAYQKLGFIDEATKLFKKCIDNEPMYRPCVSNYTIRLEYSGNHQAAVDFYIENISNGLLKASDAPLVSLAQVNQKLAFMMAINSTNYLDGWIRNSDIYDAYKNPNIDHSDLIADLINWVSQKEIKPLYWELVLLPIGYGGDLNKSTGNNIFYHKPKNINSESNKKYLKDAGIHAYWQKHGFPPLCRPLAEDDFECQ